MQTSNKPVKTRRKFDKEFKAEALRMVSEGQSSSSVARSLNISEKLLYRWKNEQKNLAGEQKRNQVDEVQQLKAQLKRVEMERDILKKALIIFGQST
jgi:transposase